MKRLSAAASEAVSEIFQTSAADAAGNLNALQSSVVSDIQKVSDNTKKVISRFWQNFRQLFRTVMPGSGILTDCHGSGEKCSLASGAAALDAGHQPYRQGGEVYRIFLRQFQEL